MVLPLKQVLSNELLSGGNSCLGAIGLSIRHTESKVSMRQLSIIEMNNTFIYKLEHSSIF